MILPHSSPHETLQGPRTCNEEHSAPGNLRRCSAEESASGPFQCRCGESSDSHHPSWSRAHGADGAGSASSGPLYFLPDEQRTDPDSCASVLVLCSGAVHTRRARRSRRRQGARCRAAAMRNQNRDRCADPDRVFAVRSKCATLATEIPWAAQERPLPRARIVPRSTQKNRKTHSANPARRHAHMLIHG